MRELQIFQEDWCLRVVQNVIFNVNHNITRYKSYQTGTIIRKKKRLGLSSRFRDGNSAQKEITGQTD